MRARACALGRRALFSLTLPVRPPSQFGSALARHVSICGTAKSGQQSLSALRLTQDLGSLALFGLAGPVTRQIAGRFADFVLARLCHVRPFLTAFPSLPAYVEKGSSLCSTPGQRASRTCRDGPGVYQRPRGRRCRFWRRCPRGFGQADLALLVQNLQRRCQKSTSFD